MVKNKFQFMRELLHLEWKIGKQFIQISATSTSFRYSIIFQGKFVFKGALNLFGGENVILIEYLLCRRKKAFLFGSFFHMTF